MACYSQEEIGEKEGVSQPQINEVLSEMAKLPKLLKFYADFDLTLKGEDYDKEGTEGVYIHEECCPIILPPPLPNTLIIYSILILITWY